VEEEAVLVEEEAVVVVALRCGVSWY